MLTFIRYNEDFVKSRFHCTIICSSIQCILPLENKNLNSLNFADYHLCKNLFRLTWENGGS